MPSPKILESKKQVVNSLADELKGAQSIILNDYMGLSVAQDTALRADFRKAGVTYRVVKNTVLLRAFEQLGLTGFEEELKGPTAVAFSENIVLAPKLSKEAADKIKSFEIKGGVVDGAKANLDEILQLASIPDQQTLYGQLAFGLMFPITSLAMTLNALAEKAAEQGKENVADVVVEKTESDETAEVTEAEETKTEE
ncbi:MAG: 50S ribosomal protein L10 [Clostridiaceae bacterium]|nr:50S ribosomal protein L10 [Clostridiaceae bacterium]